MLKTIIMTFMTALVTFTHQMAHAALEIGGCDVKGKVNVGPTLVDIDILKSGKTQETLHMKGVKGDATILVVGGFFLKPGFMAAWGDGRLSTFSIGLGHYFPINDYLTLLPSAGVTFSYLQTTVDFKEFGLVDQKEKFRSTSPFIALELCFKMTEKWTLMGVYQYAWSRTHTTIGEHFSEKEHSCGPNYSLGVDYSINQHWSAMFGVGYNIALSKEKHGIRGKGAQLGLSYYF